MALAAELRALEGVEMVAPFGNALHVSGTDHEALARAIATLSGGRRVRSARPSPAWKTCSST
jgi:hypothetical protein